MYILVHVQSLSLSQVYNFEQIVFRDTTPLLCTYNPK